MRRAPMRLAALLACAALAAGGALRAEQTTARDPAPVASPPPVRDLAASGPSVAERLAEIRRRVQSVARYPELARARAVEGEARVGFEIDAEGQPGRVAVETTSGSLALDRAAEQAVRSAGTLPYVVGRITVPVRFHLVDPVESPAAAPPDATASPAHDD